MAGSSLSCWIGNARHSYLPAAAPQGRSWVERPGMCCGCAGAGSVADMRPSGSFPLGEFMWAILPKPPSGKLSGAVRRVVSNESYESFLIQLSDANWSVGTIQVGKPQSGDSGARQ